MTRDEKNIAIAELKEKFESAQFFYLTDSSALTVEQVNNLRGLCYEKGIEMKVVKNTLAKKAMESVAEEKGYAALYDSLKGPTSVLFTDTANAPAKVIENFRKTHPKPILKAAYIDSDIFLGDEHVKTLAALKSKEELVGDIILLLQSPAKNLVGALQSGGQTIAGLVKALQERG